VIVLPADSEGWPDDRLSSVLAHEIAHVCRYDVLIQSAAYLVCALFWFAPPLWLAYAALLREAETCCDQRVVEMGVYAPEYARTIVELARLAGSNGIRYYHFLQPNQYVVDSKPLTATERAEAWVPTHPYRRAVETAYPALARAGQGLRGLGVRFTDLSAAFKDHPEPLYIDSCCHVNERGNAILADLMFQAMSSDLAAPQR